MWKDFCYAKLCIRHSFQEYRKNYPWNFINICELHIMALFNHKVYRKSFRVKASLGRIHTFPRIQYRMCMCIPKCLCFLQALKYVDTYVRTYKNIHQVCDTYCTWLRYCTWCDTHWYCRDHWFMAWTCSSMVLSISNDDNSTSIHNY